VGVGVGVGEPGNHQTKEMHFQMLGAGDTWQKGTFTGFKRAS